MTGSGSGSPCGACKFLRRKCVKGCVFAPYFCHEQGVSHFAAIHKVFGASNASKLLSHLPTSDRCEAAITISYEAQARLQDPVYGCVSHIFALQQQVVNLQTQLAILKQQAARSMINTPSPSSENPSCYYGNPRPPYHQEHQDLHQAHHLIHQTGNTNQFNLCPTDKNTLPYHQTGLVDADLSSSNNNNSMANYYNENNSTGEDHASFSSFGESSNYSDMEQQWNAFQDAEDLQSAAFGYFSYS
ncbi:PREDICTED: LOB domain-containing protein 29-like [Tarenaya hassleriana]|uniref:LOB domain-containing protein 29-like n=1 Tax=Tarenaya hassleriana TaxID=28532 RepID=UPI00053C3F6D|nr:PREDICTED: LOB domain-containing protein 29-like [Tarenaya hassleriana]